MVWLWLVGCSALWAQPALNDVQQCRDNLHLLGESLGKYARDHHGEFPKDLAELQPTYLTQLPRCPLQGDYQRISVLEHHPERALLICSSPHHSLNPGDYLVLTVEMGEGPPPSGTPSPTPSPAPTPRPGASSALQFGRLELPFARAADPVPCRHRLIQLSQRLAAARASQGRYPESVGEVRCSSGDLIRYRCLDGGENFIAYCPGAAHLGSGLAPFRPCLDRGGLHEENLYLSPPSSKAPQPEADSGSTFQVVVASLAVVTLLGLLVQRFQKRRVRLD